MLKTTLFLTILSVAISSLQLQAVTYVTDTGGYAYDESRAVTNWAPAIAGATIIGAGIIAIAVQNTHGHSSSCSYYCHSSSSYCCHSSSNGCRSSSSSGLSSSSFSFPSSHSYYLRSVSCHCQ